MPDGDPAYRVYFEHAPISIWIEDFGAVAERVHELRAQGVVDFREYFREHPEEVLRCMGSMRVVTVNAHTLDMYGARDLPHLIASLPVVFGPEAVAPLTESLASLADGERVYVHEAVNHRLDGSLLDVSLQWAVMPGHEHDWRRVLVSIQDISERKQAERAQAKLIEELRQANAQINTLAELIPICASCKKVRDDEGFWKQVEDYLHEHAGTRFSHGMCPQCLVEWYGEDAAGGS